jgi:hypothetical protein
LNFFKYKSQLISSFTSLLENRFTAITSQKKNMNTYFCVLLLLIGALQQVQMQFGYYNTTCEINETYSTCGNLCENSCSNICDIDFSTFDNLQLFQCQAGCYCSPGYIRNFDDVCVKQQPDTCGQGKQAK